MDSKQATGKIGTNWSAGTAAAATGPKSAAAGEQLPTKKLKLNDGGVSGKMGEGLVADPLGEHHKPNGGKKKLTRMQRAESDAHADWVENGLNGTAGMWRGVRSPLLKSWTLAYNQKPLDISPALCDMGVVQLRDSLRYHDEFNHKDALKQLCKRDPTAVGKSINDVRTNYNVHNFRDDQKLDAAYDAKQLRKRQQRKLKLEAEQRIEKEREKSAFHAGVLSTAAGTTAFSAGALANAAGLIAVKREKFEDLQEKSIADRQTAERRLKAETEERKRVTRLLDEKTRLLNEKDAALQLMWKKHTAVNSLCVAADRTVRERESEITSMRANQSSAADAMNKTASLEAALAREEAARVYAFRMLQETVTALERARADHLLAARHFVEQEEDFAILRSTIMGLRGTATEKKNGFSLVLGGGGHTLPRIVNDVAHVLNCADLMGWQNVKTLVDSQNNQMPLKEDILKEMEQMMQESGEGKTFHIHWSGHGKKITGDWECRTERRGRGMRLKPKFHAALVTFDEVMEMWNQSNACATGGRLLIVMDSCYSGVWVENAAKAAFDVVIQAACRAVELAEDYLWTPVWCKYAISIQLLKEKAAKSGSPFNVVRAAALRKEAASHIATLSGSTHPVAHTFSSHEIPLLHFEIGEIISAAAPFPAASASTSAAAAAFPAASASTSAAAAPFPAASASTSAAAAFAPIATTHASSTNGTKAPSATTHACKQCTSPCH